MKYSVYVEGQSEMLFITDLLSKYSGYDPTLCGYSCINLRANQHEYRSHPIQGDMDSRHYYQVINVNNDELVVSKIKNSLSDLAKKGFELIIGLRDVYGENYKKLNKNRPTVNWDLIIRMLETQNRELNSNSLPVKLHFAIMEFEAWLIALMKTNRSMNAAELEIMSQSAGLDNTQNVEEIFHPSVKLKSMLQTIDKTYDKKEGDVQSILSRIGKEEYEELRISGMSPSFTTFATTLLQPFI